MVKEPTVCTVYRIVSRKTGEPVGVHTRSCHNEYDFRSVAEARNANMNGLFKDEKLFAIAQYRVTYELIDGDVK